MKLLRYMNMRNSMKKVSLIGVCLTVTSMVVAQNVMVVKYNNGDNRYEDVGDIKEITFIKTDEVDDNTPNDVTAGLVAYYTFDNKNCSDSQGQYYGFENGASYIIDTPNGTGYSLYLKKGEYISIGSSPLNGRNNYSVSLWIKDFGAGRLIRTQKGDYFTAPSLFVTEDLRLRFYTGVSNYSSTYKTFSADMSNYQSGQWVMLTIVCEPSGNNMLSTLYVNGRKVDSGISEKTNASGGTSMCIGGDDSFRVDDVRLYNVTLTEDQVADIYNREKEKARVTISPQELFFDKESSQQEFTISNHTLNNMKYSVNDNIGIIKYSPSSDYIPAKGVQKVSVTISDRDLLDKYLRGCINVVTENSNNTIAVQIAKGKETQESGVDVKRGLTAFYSFDNDDAKDDMPYEYDGALNGGRFISDTPCGQGKALLLKKGENVVIGDAPLDGRNNYSVSLWIKDFGAGRLIRTQKGDYFTAPSLFVTEDLRLRFYTGVSNYSSTYKTFSADMSNYQSGQWVMLTIVCEPSGNSLLITLYVNGRKVDSGISEKTNASGGTSMCIGGDDPLIIDNVRLYSVALSDDEVAEIYASESRF